MKATKKFRITKAHLICFVLGTQGAMTRDEVMRRVHTLEGKQGAFSPTSNNCYWSPTGHGNGGRSSVVFKGLVEKAGRQDRCFLYRNTPKGDSLCEEYILCG